MDEVPIRKLYGSYTRRILGKFSWPKALWVITWVALAVGLAFTPTLGTRILAILAVLIGAVGIWPFSYGPGFSYVLERNESATIRRRKGRVAQQARPGSKRRATNKEPIKVEIHAYPTAVPDRDSLGIYHFPETKGDASIITGEAWPGANIGASERFSSENELAKAVLDATNMTADSTGIIIGAHKGPVDIWRSRDWEAESVHQNVVNAGRYDFGVNPPTNVYERQSANFSELDLNRRLFTRDVTGYVGLNVTRPKDFAEIEKAVVAGKMSPRQFENRMLISRMTRRLEENLKAQGITGLKALDEKEIRSFAKSTFELQDIDAWNYLMRHPDSEEAIPMTSADKFWPWPRKEPLVLSDYLGRPYINFDESLFRIARATKLNETVFPGEFKPLFMSGDIGLANQTSLNISLSGMTYSAKDESKALTYAILVQKALSGIFESDETYRTMEDEANANALRERQNRYFLGGKQALGFNLYAVWGGVDEEALEEADRAVQEHARSCDIKLQLIPLESRQIRAFFSANIGGFLI